jgi:hypothetical protein
MDHESRQELHYRTAAGTYRASETVWRRVIGLDPAIRIAPRSCSAGDASPFRGQERRYGRLGSGTTA